MKKAILDDIKNNMFAQIVKFDKMLFDAEWINESQKRNLANKVISAVDTIYKHNVDDCDLWVFLTFREGKLRSKNSRIRKLEPKTLANAIVEGFELPDTTTMVEIENRPVMEKDYNRVVSSSVLYEVKFGLGNNETLTAEQLKRRYNLKPSDNLFSVEDMHENSKILKFFHVKKKQKQRVSARSEDAGLSL